eukprot:TRINITY_DN10612_c0_g1_i1.p1 TRINITY_DN10612_c0_g1~~TRINITY_DN10612_c0_g1_i1.p1  ORF type:complete len:137 (+),score=38.40 TRINITY_DN10612_c0_g1_i1:161-571(+)
MCIRDSNAEYGRSCFAHGSHQLTEMVNSTTNGTFNYTPGAGSISNDMPGLLWLPATVAYGVIILAAICIVGTYCYYKGSHRYTMVTGISELDQLDDDSLEHSVLSPASRRQLEPMEAALQQEQDAIELEMTTHTID